MARIVAGTSFERAQQALCSSSIRALRELKVEQVNNTLVISGSVETFYHKQLAQEIVRTVSAGCDMVNDINVQYVTKSPIVSP